METGYRVLADLVLLLHLGFIGFVMVGGAWAAGRPRWRRWHLPAFCWGALVELFGWPCPLTPVEQWLRLRAGAGGYSGDFVGHYLLALIYPEALTRGEQVALGGLVLAVNLFWYARAWARR